MTSGFQTKEGTDLDNVFLVNNSGGQYFNLKVSTGQDLGQRYSTAFALNRDVGFQNTAGTDIGRICGNIVPATLTNYWANVKWTNEHNAIRWRGALNVGCNAYGDGLNWALCMCVWVNQSSDDGKISVRTNSTTEIPARVKSTDQMSTLGTQWWDGAGNRWLSRTGKWYEQDGPLAAGAECQWVTAYWGSCGANPGMDCYITAEATYTYETGSGESASWGTAGAGG